MVALEWIFKGVRTVYEVKKLIYLLIDFFPGKLFFQTLSHVNFFRVSVRLAHRLAIPFFLYVFDLPMSNFLAHLCPQESKSHIEISIVINAFAISNH